MHCTVVDSCREDKLTCIILPDRLQWRLVAMRDVGSGKMVARVVALDDQLFVTRRR